MPGLERAAAGRAAAKSRVACIRCRVEVCQG
jgi:hypothetical protein